MKWTQKVVSSAVGLALTAQVASAQIPVNYSTSGNFTGFCAGISCTKNGMTLTFNPLANNQIVLDTNNGYFSFLSYGDFTVSGGIENQVSFADVGFNLTLTQTTPTGGSQTLIGVFAGGVDKTSSSLRWNALPTTFSIGAINYTTPGQVNLQAPTSNGGVTSIQGSVSTNVVPEPSTYLLMSAGLAGVLVLARKRRVS